MMRTIQEQLSIVIPVLDDAEGLAALLAVLGRVPLVREIIVVDGGSSDGSTAVAAAAGAQVIVAPRGRGGQLAAGAAEAMGKWLLFLHADCRPLQGWEAAVRGFIDGGVGEVAGYFALALDDPAPAARRLERFVAWRCRTLALPYGDQGLLVSQRLYDAVGGYRTLPLMEDVDLVRRLGRARLRPVGATMLASARRYRRDGYRRRSLRNLCCLALYFAGVPPKAIARMYG
ncbi:MAG TPA: TIGR04283 family arsenosugar biosynthesis glycosyltransferase [Stellaceae bacterium]|jgi:rSAM/selenodomain-associated transferase 2|nr:TIGR04283 family arsenosugar biosynthesis glycosyltransferase [Stellaceae bacterium]